MQLVMEGSRLYRSESKVEGTSFTNARSTPHNDNTLRNSW